MKAVIKEKPCASSFQKPLDRNKNKTKAVSNGTNMHAKFHHKPRLQGSIVTVVFHSDMQNQKYLFFSTTLMQDLIMLGTEECHNTVTKC
jgi:hypothetical protein